jgi:hypothetical protein
MVDGKLVAAGAVGALLLSRQDGGPSADEVTEAFERVVSLGSAGQSGDGDESPLGQSVQMEEGLGPDDGTSDPNGSNGSGSGTSAPDPSTGGLVDGDTSGGPDTNPSERFNDTEGDGETDTSGDNRDRSEPSVGDDEPVGPGIINDTGTDGDNDFIDTTPTSSRTESGGAFVRDEDESRESYSDDFTDAVMGGLN